MERIFCRTIRRSRRTLYLVNFFLSFHYFLFVYITSSFLSLYFSTNLISALFVVGAALSIPFYLFGTNILSRFGAWKSITTLLLLDGSSLIALSFTHNPLFLIALFILQQVTIVLIAFVLDVLLENYSSDEKTGGTRGFFFTTSNLALVFSPIVAGTIAAHYGFTKVFLLSSSLILPALFILYLKFKNFADPIYKRGSLKEVWQIFQANFDVFSITVADFLLQLFYAFMVIYTPLYLYSTINFSWEEIGIILSIAVLPFLFLELPLGYIADRYLGEKELLVGGFIILGISTIVFAFLPGKNLLMFALTLLSTRIGASFVEMMCESYFFKQVDTKDVALMGYFRIPRALSFVAAPLIAWPILAFGNYQLLFVIVGLLMLTGMYWALSIRDTR